MEHLRVAVPTTLTPAVLAALSDDPAVASLTCVEGASLVPVGDVVEADVAREGLNEIVDRLQALHVHRDGVLQIQSGGTWISQGGREAERRTPGASADSVVWANVTQRAYEESELNWTYLIFMTLATLIAGIAIVLDSQILVIGAMVLGPEFVAIASLGLALVRKRSGLFWLAFRTLVVGFAVAIAIVAACGLLGRWLGWIVITDVTGPRPETAFIYSPDKWSFVVAVIAAVAGVLSLTSAKVGGLSGVFISVTTIPAAANVGLGVAFGVPHEIWGSLGQLLLNIAGMAIAGWLTLAVQQAIWNRVSSTDER